MPVQTDPYPTAQTALAPPAGLTAEDIAFLAELDEKSPFEVAASRRSFLGQSARATAGVAAAAAIGSGAIKLFQASGGIVATAQGAERAVPRITPAPALPSLATARAPRQIVANAADRHEWELFRRRFTSADGRVIDTGNDGVSHTEGQGWGLLFSVAFDDRASFERILAWTGMHLRRPDDALHAWRYVPGAPVPVADMNNATDGDLFIACALWRAAFRWNCPQYAAQAQVIARDVLRLCVRRIGTRTVLLPGSFGFDGDGAVNVNPSYYAFAAMAELADAVPSPLWARLRDDGVAMIAAGRFGACQLPPDWLSVSSDGALAPARGWPARFSYDAIRIPLHLSWAGLTQPSLREAFRKFCGDSGSQAAWVDLRTNDRASYAACPGMVAIAKIATAPGKTALPRDFPAIRSSPDYYSAALTLLARLAWQEMMLV